MRSFLDKFLGRKKTLPELVEENLEDLIKRSIEASIHLDPIIQGAIVLKAIGEGTSAYKAAYNASFKEMGYSKEQYDQLVDQTCSKLIDKYIE